MSMGEFLVHDRDGSHCSRPPTPDYLKCGHGRNVHAEWLPLADFTDCPVCGTTHEVDRQCPNHGPGEVHVPVEQPC